MEDVKITFSPKLFYSTLFIEISNIEEKNQQQQCPRVLIRGYYLYARKICTRALAKCLMIDNKKVYIDAILQRNYCSIGHM